MKKYRSIIINDELNDNKTLENYLKKHFADIILVGMAYTIKEAKELINGFEPEIIYLYPKNNDKNSYLIFEYLSNITVEVIVVSPNKNDAIIALKKGASDFVLNPIIESNLISATQMVKEKIMFKKKQFKKTSSKKDQGQNKDYIVLPSNLDKLDLINVNTILYCEANSNLTTFYFNNKKEKIANKNLLEYEKILNGNFFRVHNKYLVNLEAVLEIKKDSGNYCKMINGKLIPISRRKFDILQRYLKLK